MTWLESHQSLRDHPKTRRLGRRLGGLAAAIGHLHGLWWWCLDYAPDGDLTRYAAEDIATAALWDGDPDVLLEALVECGFLDRTKSSLSVHDWADYGGKTIKRRSEAAERQRQHRSKDADSSPSVTPTSHVSHNTQTNKQTYKELCFQQEGKNGGQPVDNHKTPLCPTCGTDLAWDGDGTTNRHCTTCDYRDGVT